MEPRIITTRFPQPITDPKEIGNWTSQFGKQMEAFTYLLERVLRNTTLSAGSGSGGSGGVPLPINAATLEGHNAAYFLSRSNHTGPWYTNFEFANELSGFVLKGTPNNGAFRVGIDDLNPGAIVGFLETKGAAQPGDIEFSSSASGPVLLSRKSNSYYRLGVDDSQAGAPILFCDKLAGIGSTIQADYVFGHNGFSFITRGRTNLMRCLCFIDDSAGVPTIAWENL